MAMAAQKIPLEVHDTPELHRVLNLPRREWEESALRNDLYLRMTTAYRTPTGQQVLRLAQAAALIDLHDVKGLLAPMNVGSGKTLVCFLAPLVLEAKRPVLLIPGGLKDKTWREFSKLLYHWKAHPAWLTKKNFLQHCISYDILSRDSGADLLNEIRPDLIIADEAHKLKERARARTKRVERYMIANPHTIFAALSGTITKRSIKDYWHLAYYSLKMGMPLPRIEAEADRWAEALDERKTEAISRRAPGALLRFCTPLEVQSITHMPPAANVTEQMFQTLDLHNKRLEIARLGYQRRLRQTPGVIVLQNPEVPGCSLEIRQLNWDVSEDVKAHLKHLRETWETPDGQSIAMPTDVWRHARTLACGFYYLWDPPAPEVWRQKRKAWHWCLRQVLLPDGIYYHQLKHLKMDTPLQVINSIRSGKIADQNIAKIFLEWEQVKPMFKPRSVARWIDDHMLNHCVTWARHHHKGIIWTEHQAFGRALAKALDTGFCAEGGLDARGRLIDDYEGRLVVASVGNREGRNLQAWNRNLIVTAPPNGKDWEQLLGRTHRPGQTEDTVYVDWVCAVDEQYDGFQQVLADAKYIEQSTGLKQKILYADHV